MLFMRMKKAASAGVIRGTFFNILAPVLFIFLLMAATARAGTYQAPLAAELSTDPDMCKYAPCKEVLPEADSFSERKGKPAYVEAYKTSDGQKNLVGYVFLSTDIVDIPAYSGKPVVTLIGMDVKGIIKDVRILRHSEPILMVGIPEEELTKFVKQYIGKFVGDKIEVGKGEEKGGYIGIDAITGATVTVIAENRTILRSGQLIAKQVGIMKPVPREPLKIRKTEEIKDWEALVKEGSIQHLVVKPGDVGVEDKGEPWMDVYFGTLDQPGIAKSVLGENTYDFMMRDWQEGDHAIFIAGGGEYSFKGSGFVRGAIFDRIQIAQGDDTYTFMDKDYYNLTELAIKGAPEFKEGGIFIVRKGSFDPAYPWSLVVLTATREMGAKEKKFFTFSKEYLLHEKYIEGKRVIVKEEAPWVRVWMGNIGSISFLLIYLLVIVVLFTRRFKLVQNRTAAKWTRYAIMAVSLVFVGYYKMAQPSVTQAITLTHEFIKAALLKGFNWGLFLLDPMIFILWWFIGITIIIWGRGVFCGWICPYGVLTEFAYKTFHRIFPNRFKYELPYGLHKWLIYLKYGVFGLLLIVSLKSMETAEKLAEIEPFKTAFLVGPLNREWPFMLYFFALLAACLVTYRFFCKYICPLGAGLAAPSTFRLFGIKRRDFCTKCHICARSCTSQAIDESGKIDRRECMYCLECEENFYDTEKCPPLIKEKREREKGA